MVNNPSASSPTGELQIEVFGVNLNGRHFIEQTRTLTIARDGATIPLASKLAPESEVIVRNPATNDEAVARVVDLIQVQDTVPIYVYGIAFVDPSVNLWQVEFPEAPSSRILVMECSRCHAVDAVLLSEIEMLMFESKQTLRRYCECNNSSPIWRQQTDRRVNERRATERGASDRRRSIEGPATRARQERRRDKRTEIRALASIRCNGGEIIGECEDLSRGGFCFKSRKAYPVEMRIEAAVPYTKNSVNIFVVAQIASQQEMIGGFYRHGVVYAKSIDRKSQ